MSNPNEFVSDEFGRSRSVRVQSTKRSLSIMALASFVLGILFFIPLFPMVACVLGFLAMQRTKDSIALKGRSLAMAGLCFGLVSSVLQVFAGVQAYRVYDFATNGPERVITYALAGNTDDFRSAFINDAGMASDQSIARFSDTLRRRYGGLQSVTLQDTQDIVQTDRGASFIANYEFTFNDRTVPASVHMLIADGALPGVLSGKIERIEFSDEEQGSLEFPIPLSVATGSDS
ncbi:MAG: DUF4190 domain-containing protein [Planctomycetota bacterium]